MLLAGLIEFGPQSVPAQLLLNAAAEKRRAAARDGVAGGRIYDAHIAEVARAAGADVVVTDNRRHCLAALRHALETPAEFVDSLKRKRP